MSSKSLKIHADNFCSFLGCSVDVSSALSHFREKLASLATAADGFICHPLSTSARYRSAMNLQVPLSNHGFKNSV